jgi:hypothetical protein
MGKGIFYEVYRKNQSLQISMQKIFIFVYFVYTAWQYFLFQFSMFFDFQTFVTDFFVWLWIELQWIGVVLNGENLDVRIETPDSHLLIGTHGKTLDSLVHLLGRMIEKQTGKYTYVHLEVNDYMQAKDDRFFRFLDHKIQFVQQTGKTIRIPNLTSFERKKAHGFISEKKIEWLSTHSDGQGNERVLVIEFTGKQLADTPMTPHNTAYNSEFLSEDGVWI